MITIEQFLVGCNVLLIILGVFVYRSAISHGKRSGEGKPTQETKPGNYLCIRFFDVFGDNKFPDIRSYLILEGVEPKTKTEQPIYLLVDRYDILSDYDLEGKNISIDEEGKIRKIKKV